MSRAVAARARGRVAVAYSGGRDSTALLHATLQQARKLKLEVHALHVHHGLSVHADAWLAHCERRCRRWAADGAPLVFHHARLHLAPARGDSIEALARRGRYAALAQMAREAGCDVVLLGQHAQDQAETLLLQALRGAGPAGLAAMPREAARNGITWCRPWLEQPRSAVENYIRAHRLRHVEDDSNADPRFARNRLRLQVWPALQAAFPDAVHTLGDAARWAQDAAQCLAALAALDLASLPAAGDALPVPALVALGRARGRNALRAWLLPRLGRAAPATLLDRLWRELPGSDPARWLAGPAGELRRHRGALHWIPAAGGAPREAVPVEGPPPDVDLGALSAGERRVPAWQGTLVAEPVTEGGVAASLLGRVRLVARSGGEQFQRSPGAMPRALKKQYQALGVPAWERSGPLVYGGPAGDQLLLVPGLGLDARALARAGEPQLALRWERGATA